VCLCKMDVLPHPLVSRKIPLFRQTWPRLTLLVNAKMRGKAVLYTMCANCVIILFPSVRT
jgi:hypothetical protein